MSNKDLFKQAIAEAKTIREAAITNAKEALEESLTPHLKEMLAQKLQEMEEGEEEDENVKNENIYEAEEEEVETEEGEEVEGEEAEEEGEEAEEEELDLENMSVEEFKDLVRDIVAQEIGQEGSEEEMSGEEAPEGEEDMVAMDSEEEEININELLAELQEMDQDEAPVSENAIVDAGMEIVKFFQDDPNKLTAVLALPGMVGFAKLADKLGLVGKVDMGFNRVPRRGPGMEESTQELNENPIVDAGMEIVRFFQDDPNKLTAVLALPGMVGFAKLADKLGLIGKVNTGMNKPGGMGPKLEGTLNENALVDAGMEIAKFFQDDPNKLTAVLALPGMFGFAKLADKLGLQGKIDMGFNRVPRKGPGMEESTEELEEALETVAELRTQLQEVNLLNAKLLYVNKVFKANNLTESQKVNVVAAFDKAETVKEVKLVFETVSKNVVAKPATIKEHKSFASSAAGTAATAGKKEIISEVSEQVARWQKLAGIIK